MRIRVRPAGLQAYVAQGFSPGILGMWRRQPCDSECGARLQPCDSRNVAQGFSPRDSRNVAQGFSPRDSRNVAQGFSPAILEMWRRALALRFTSQLETRRTAGPAG